MDLGGGDRALARGPRFGLIVLPSLIVHCVLIHSAAFVLSKQPKTLLYFAQSFKRPSVSLPSSLVQLGILAYK
jgi:hypothetical protein